MSIQRQQDLAIYWDYDSTRSSSAASSVTTYNVVGNIRSASLEYGPIKSFRAYGNFSGATLSSSVSVRSELLSSGVTVIDFPEEGQRDAGVKMMLVDIMAHAWDYPASHTYVVISNDRGVGYALSMLRMRKSFVILISSIVAHADLTANASLKLDWSRISLGIHNDSTELPSFPEVNPSSPKSASSAFRPVEPGTRDASRCRGTRKESESRNSQKPVGEENDDLVELQDLPPPRPHSRSRNHSVFSTHDFHTFGGFADIAFSPKLRPSFSGNGPLFPRSKSVGEHRIRPESVPLNAVPTSSLSKSVFPPFFEDECSSSSSWKGKVRDEFAHTPGTHETSDAQTRSAFDPFHETLLDIHASSTMPMHYQKDQMIHDILTSTTSSSSSGKFSTVHRSDTTALTSAVTGTGTLKDVNENQSSSKVGFSLLNAQPQGCFALERSRLSSEEDSTTTVKAEKATFPIFPPLVAPITDTCNEEIAAVAKTPPLPSLPLKASVSQVIQPIPTPTVFTAPSAPKVEPSPPKATVPSLKAAPSTAKAAPTASSKLSDAQSQPPSTQPPQSNNVPAHFQPLVAVLRRKRNAVARTDLGSLLVKENGNIYKLAGVTRFSTYISMAVAAGIVTETGRERAVALVPGYI